MTYFLVVIVLFLLFSIQPSTERRAPRNEPRRNLEAIERHPLAASLIVLAVVFVSGAFN